MSSDLVFSVGDLVRLKSGGPAMTVTDIVKEYGDPKPPELREFRTQWFSGKKSERGQFPAVALVPVSPDEVDN